MKRLRIPMLAAALVSGFLVAFSASGASQSAEAELLAQAWETQKTASLYAKWSAQNKGEAATLDTYWATGVDPPTLATAYGRSWVQVAQAYWSLQEPAPATTEPGTTTSPPPPSPIPLSSPVGHHNAASPGYWPPTRLDKYGYVSTEGPAPAGFQGLNLVYRSAITCGAGYTNVSEATCVNNGWAMRDANGNLMRSGFGGVIADPAIPGYQAAWAAATYQRILEQQEHGAWVDDFSPKVDALATCGCWPANYPNMEAFEQGLLSFASYMRTYFGSRNLKTAYNSGIPLDDNASLVTAWWAQLGPHADYLTIENWLTPNGFLRRSGPEWHNNWSQFRNLHRVARQAGAGFLPYDYPAGGQSQAYTLATFLLDWDGTAVDGFAVWLPGSVDAWIPFYDQVLSLGRPIAATVDNGNIHTRRFEHGTLTVDSGAGTTTIGP